MDKETQNDSDEVEKCDACGKIDDTTNSDQLIGCDIHCMSQMVLQNSQMQWD